MTAKKEKTKEPRFKKIPSPIPPYNSIDYVNVFLPIVNHEPTYNWNFCINITIILNTALFARKIYFIGDPDATNAWTTDDSTAHVCFKLICQNFSTFLWNYIICDFSLKLRLLLQKCLRLALCGLWIPFWSNCTEHTLLATYSFLFM